MPATIMTAHGPMSFGGGPWCWDTAQGCDVQQRVALAVAVVLLSAVLLAGIYAWWADR